ncbi:MAG: transketolase [Burkholderiales bacterium]
MATKQEIARLEKLAYEMRRKLLEFCGSYEGTVHIGGDLSMTDILVALYNYGLNVDPNDICMPTRDRFIMSKGHGAFAMYLAMSMRGFFDYNEIVRTYGKVDSAFGMHPCKVHLPGVECSSGSLGQGLAMACGLALSAKHKNADYRVFCMLGDGETCEGEVWEAAMTASSYKLGNLVAIIDRNHQLMTAYTEDFITMEPYAEKWRAFGWNTVVIDGHDMKAITDALDNLPDAHSSVPTAIVCETIKGKGVSFMERAVGWHAGCLSHEDMVKALADVDADWEKRNKGGN